MSQERCPACGQTRFSQVSYRKDPATGERAARPMPTLLPLAISTPVGLLAAYMFFQYGPGSGYGLWVLGIAIGIATPIYVWRRLQAYNQLPEEPGKVCANCGYRQETDNEQG